MTREPTTPRMKALYDAARARPLRGTVAALSICAAGVLLGLAERLIDVPEGAVLAAAAERKKERESR